MLNAILDVREIPNLLTSKYHSNIFSCREENGAILFQPVSEKIATDRRKKAFAELKKFRGVLPKDFDYKKEKMKALDEKYGSIH